MKSHEQQSYTCDIILLGLQGTGKSFLVKQMQSYLNGEDITKNYFDLIPTFGVNLDELKFSSKGKAAATRNSPATDKCTSICVREVGGGLLLGWNRYIDDCKMIIYMVDMSNHAQLASSSIELLNLLSTLRKEHKPFLVLLNKMDAPSCIQVDDFKRMIRWNDLVRYCSTKDSACNHMQIHLKLNILTLSAFTGHGIDELIQYIELVKLLVCITEANNGYLEQITLCKQHYHHRITHTMDLGNHETIRMWCTEVYASCKRW